MEIYGVKEVEQNPLPKSQEKPFYIGTKQAPSDDRAIVNTCVHIKVMTSILINTKQNIYI